MNPRVDHFCWPLVSEKVVNIYEIKCQTHSITEIMIYCLCEEKVTPQYKVGLFAVIYTHSESRFQWKFGTFAS